MKWNLLNEWPCDICHQMRHDSKISVITYPLKISKYARRNLKYCNDNPACMEAAVAKAKAREI